MAAIEFLTAIGKISTPTRQEFILLSDILGLSALVDSMNHPVKEGSTATESSVLGPFHVEDSPEIPMGGSIASEGKGEYMYISGRVLDTRGQPIPDCLIDTWEGDTEGFYDTVSNGKDDKT
jgi:protocatechuate 3,4-dioxygenase beta subunit